jgi:hypothetical protein
MSSQQSNGGTRPVGSPTERVSFEAPTVHRLSHAELADRASDLAERPVTLLREPLVLELTARHPYDEHGNIDVYKPGRWDTSSNQILMDTIRQVGPSPGEWEGSAAYIDFKPPSSGTYLIVAHFTGYQTTMHLRGPWGDTTAYTAQTSDSGAVVALWTGQEVNFTMDCRVPDNGYGIGVIESIQIHALA